MFIFLGRFLMSSAVHGKNWKEPQTLLKMEKVNDYEAEYDIQASVESRAEEISSNYYRLRECNLFSKSEN